MDRAELKQIIQRIIRKVEENKDDAPQPACLFGDNVPPGPTTKYAIGEEG